MSTKIYNAFIFDGSAEELMLILKDIKNKYLEITQKYLMGLNYKNWTFTKKRYPFLDSDMNIKEIKDCGFGEFLLQDIIDREKRLNEHHPYNIDASAVVYFHKNKIYVQFFGLPRGYEKTFLNDKFKDYHYQNSTDQSNYDWEKEEWDEMSPERQKELEDEWKERENVWDEILPGWSAPVEHGLIFDFLPNGYNFSKFCDEILESIEI